MGNAFAFGVLVDAFLSGPNQWKEISNSKLPINLIFNYFCKNNIIFWQKIVTNVILTHFVFKFILLLLLITKFQNNRKILFFHVSHLPCNVIYIFGQSIFLFKIFHTFAISKTGVSDIYQLFMINIFVIIMTRSKRCWESSGWCHVSLVNAVLALSSEHFLTHNWCKSIVSQLFMNSKKVTFKHCNLSITQHIFLWASNHQSHNFVIFGTSHHKMIFLNKTWCH